MPHIGSKCCRQDCRQVNEYLPTKCVFCSLLFCQEHYVADKKLDLERGHLCLKYPVDERAVECPLCKQVLSDSRGKNLNQVVDLHIQSGCPNTSLQSTIYKNNCGFKGCTKREVIPITCKECGDQFCIKHRLEADHKCLGSNGKSRKSTQSKGSKGSAKSRKNNDCLLM